MIMNERELEQLMKHDIEIIFTNLLNFPSMNHRTMPE